MYSIRRVTLLIEYENKILDSAYFYQNTWSVFSATNYKKPNPLVKWINNIILQYQFIAGPI